MIGRFIISFIAVFTAVSPYGADWNETHIYNPKWPPHAKFHNAQTMLMGALLGMCSLYYLWGKKKNRENLQIGTLLAALYWVTQSGSILFPGTAFIDPEFAAQRSMPKIGGVIPFNQSILDGIIVLILSGAYFLEQDYLKKSDLKFVSPHQ